MHIAIVGAGFSGVALLCQLVAQSAPLTRVTLFGTAADFGRGRAYAGGDDLHLLNVRAADMGLRPEAPGEFADWLELAGSNRDAFLPRSLYGDYLGHCLDTAIAGARFPVLRVRQPLAAITPTGAGFRLRTCEGDQLHADQVVLALGSLPPRPLSGLAPALQRDPRYIDDPWAPSALDLVHADQDVVVVGTGLTCFDLLQSLLQRGHRGRIRALSRHGLIPAAQPARRGTPLPPSKALQAALLRPRLRELLPILRQACARAPDWRAVIDGLRPHTTELWRGLGQSDRARFMRHLRSYWEVHRHRLPLQSHQLLQTWINSGRVELHAARLEAAEPLDTARGLRLAVRTRGAERAQIWHTDVLIRATGLDTDVAATSSPLLKQLREDGWICQDPLGLGLLCDGGSGVLNRTGHRTPGLHALGPLLRGEHWEMTAVPELRVAARALALELTEIARGIPDECPRLQFA